MEIKYPKIKTTSRTADLAFVVTMKGGDGETEKFFGGFVNETECPGEENECQCWEEEDWVDDVEEAQQFCGFADARSWLDVVDAGKRASCGIVLYGRNEEDERLYPLKVFVEGGV